MRVEEKNLTVLRLMQLFGKNNMDTTVDYVERAKDILSGCLFIPKESIQTDADISSLGELDSLTFELVVLEIEKGLGHEVDPVELLEMRSVKDLAQLLQNRQS